MKMHDRACPTEGRGRSDRAAGVNDGKKPATASPPPKGRKSRRPSCHEAACGSTGASFDQGEHQARWTDSSRRGGSRNLIPVDGGGETYSRWLESSRRTLSR